MLKIIRLYGDRCSNIAIRVRDVCVCLQGERKRGKCANMTLNFFCTQTKNYSNAIDLKWTAAETNDSFKFHFTHLRCDSAFRLLFANLYPNLLPSHSFLCLANTNTDFDQLQLAFTL